MGEEEVGREWNEGRREEEREGGGRGEAEK